MQAFEDLEDARREIEETWALPRPRGWGAYERAAQAPPQNPGVLLGSDGPWNGWTRACGK